MHSDEDPSEPLDASELLPFPLFPPERIVLGENTDGSLAVLVTDAGREAAEAAGLPVDCALCRTLFATGEAFYKLVLGLDETPDTVGAPPGSHNLIETTTEITLCKACHGKAEPLVYGLIDALWSLRAPDSELAGDEEPIPPTEKV